MVLAVLGVLGMDELGACTNNTRLSDELSPAYSFGLSR